MQHYSISYLKMILFLTHEGVVPYGIVEPLIRFHLEAQLGTAKNQVCNLDIPGPKLKLANSRLPWVPIIWSQMKRECTGLMLEFKA